MQIGVQLPEVEREVSWAEVRDIALAAEASGLDSIWVGDHLLFRHDQLGVRGPWESWSLLAALAEATDRVTLGPLVASTSFHSPAMLAKKAATVDEISGGRLVLGLGAGWNRYEYEAFGFPFDRRVSRFAEAFTIIRKLIREGSVDFQGEHYTVRDSELLPRARPDLPLLIGSNGDRMLRIALPHVDMWNTWYLDYGNDAEGLRPLLTYVEEICREVGRDPGEVARSAAVYVQLARGEGRPAGSAEKPSSDPIRGSHEEIATRLAAFAGVGASHLQVVLDPIDATAVEELGAIVELARADI